MNKRNILTSPTPWLAAGMGLVVALVSLLMGAGESLDAWLVKGFEGNGFPELAPLSASSPTALVALVICTVGAVFAIEGTPGVGRRVMLLLSGMVVFAMASPVLALWGVLWNPFILLISVLWAGVAAMVQAASRDKVEALRIANEQNVVRMNVPISPNDRRKRR